MGTGGDPSGTGSRTRSVRVPLTVGAERSARCDGEVRRHDRYSAGADVVPGPLSLAQHLCAVGHGQRAEGVLLQHAVHPVRLQGQHHAETANHHVVAGVQVRLRRREGCAAAEQDIRQRREVGHRRPRLAVRVRRIGLVAVDRGARQTGDIRRDRRPLGHGPEVVRVGPGARICAAIDGHAGVRAVRQFPPQGGRIGPDVRRPNVVVHPGYTHRLELFGRLRPAISGVVGGVEREVVPRVRSQARDGVRQHAQRRRHEAAAGRPRLVRGLVGLAPVGVHHGRRRARLRQIAHKVDRGVQHIRGIHVGDNRLRQILRHRIRVQVEDTVRRHIQPAGPHPVGGTRDGGKLDFVERALKTADISFAETQAIRACRRRRVGGGQITNLLPVDIPPQFHDARRQVSYVRQMKPRAAHHRARRLARLIVLSVAPGSPIEVGQCARRSVIVPSPP